MAPRQICHLRNAKGTVKWGIDKKLSRVDRERVIRRWGRVALIKQSLLGHVWCQDDKAARQAGQGWAAFAFARRIALALLSLLMGAIAISSPAAANSKYAALVMDANTDKIIFSRNANQPRYPASLTKIMTLYLVFDELEAGRLTLNTRMKVSRRAANQKPSRLGLKPGSSIRVKDAILALVTKSANDVAVVIAEHISGRESKFATHMTKTAKSLGMTRTRFLNASGLPNRAQKTTAADMATLAIRIQEDFPQYYHYFGTKKFKWNGRTFRNHNNLLGKYRGTNGIKTGYIRASGFNLTSSVERDGKHLIGVVLGGKSARSRDRHMIKILNSAFPRAQAVTPAKQRTAANTPVPLSRPALPVMLAQADITGGIAQSSTQSPDNNADASDNWLISPANAATGPAAAIPATQPAVANDNTPAPDISEPGVAEEAVANWRAEEPLFPDGTWIIQIGAYNSSADAVDNIRRALAVAPAELTKAVPITVPVETATRTLYRSRFGGFVDEKAAMSACGKLVRGAMSCIPIPPSNWSVPGDLASNR